jgi:N6-adenosine-specific RNA methylase IME4
MKGVRCSWADMQKIRLALSNRRRGDQKRLQLMRCVDKSTVATWRAAIAVLDATDGKVEISQLSHFQPSHAVAIARAFRRNGKHWSEDTKEQIAAWVRRCEDEALSVQQLRKSLRQPVRGAPGTEGGCTVAHLDLLAERKEQFRCLYADPPWPYDNQATRASTDNHYETMSVDAICELPVGQLAADQSHLHLWATNAFLSDALRVIAAWGFEYKGHFCWTKPHLGLGNYWRVAHELLLLGVRGNLVFADRSLRSWGEYPRTAHSAKPPGLRRLIERASPRPRLELFGRHPTSGRVVWGDQIPADFFARTYP